MAFFNGALHLLEPESPRGQRMPIDFFFRSLAQDQHEHAIGIVLSGTGSDGTLGVRAIKGEGGMAMAQSPESTEYDGMPRSAIATGLVDYELLPADMPSQLIAYVAHAFGRLPRQPTAAPPKAENALKKIFILLRSRTGHDFSQYKPSSINRRIERRMAVHQIESIDEYHTYLHRNPAEVDALFRDLLIGVTGFFREPEAFQALDEKAIAKLLAHKPAGGAIRVWSPGCATGEEAYSLAILLAERQEALKRSFTVQIFATDIDTPAIEIARAGVYPASITADLTPERLARFFSAGSTNNTVLIHKSIRDMLVFSEQDVATDPPFSKIDLISCRNLLIYLNADLQKKLISLFHYALNPGGYLFLGTSETVGEFDDLFATVDRTAKLYQRKEAVDGIKGGHLGRLLPTRSTEDTARPQPPAKKPFPAGVSLRELTEQTLLRQTVPAAALVNAEGDIRYVHGRTGLFLEPAPGEATLNILKMAREGLKRDLTTALHHAVRHREIVRRPGLHVKSNGEFTTVNLTVRPTAPGPPAEGQAAPADSSDSPLFLVILETAPVEEPPPAQPKDAGTHVSEPDADDRVAELQQELRAKEEYLQATLEELETSNEELTSSNEEMQTVNEELQSTNEELVTAKEELQSVNEELSTVNTELESKVAELTRANNDMNNLLAGTNLATVFLDQDLRILRFTPAATRIINLIDSDIGRPVAHIVSNLKDYDTLFQDIKAVLDTLVPKDREVQTAGGEWYLMRIQPYRTLENVTEGAVITFVDTDKLKKVQQKQRRPATVVRDSNDAITVQDFSGNILAWNRSAERMYGWSESEALTMNIADTVPPEKRSEALSHIELIKQGKEVESYDTQRMTKDGQILDVWMTITVLLDDTGRPVAAATTERDITDWKRIVNAMREQSIKGKDKGKAAKPPKDTGGVP